METQLNFTVDYDIQDDTIYLTKDGVLEDEFPLMKTNPVEQLIRTELETIGVINPFGKQIVHPLNFTTFDSVKVGETADGETVSLLLLDRHITIVGRGGSGRDNLLRSILLHVAAFPERMQATAVNFKDASLLNTVNAADNIEGAAVDPLTILDNLYQVKWVMDSRKRHGWDICSAGWQKAVLLFVHEPEQMMGYSDEHANLLKAIREEGPDFGIYVISSVSRVPEGDFLSTIEDDLIVTVGNLNKHDRETVFGVEADFVSDANPVGVSWMRTPCYNSEGEPVDEHGEVVDFGSEHRKLVRFYDYLVRKDSWDLL